MAIATSLSRRLLLRGIASLGIGSTVGGCAWLLEGCGGKLPDEGGGPSPVIGKVNLAEIGGIGLKVANSLTPGVPVGDGGTFVAPLPSNAQLLLVLDEVGDLRGAAVTAGQAGRSVSEFDVGAQSTALAILMLTPGIAAADPELFAARKAYLEGHPSFLTLVSVLRDNLSRQTLAVALTTPDAVAALEDCVSSFALRFLSPVSREVGVDADEHLIQLHVTEPLSPATSIVIRNSGWRFARITRKLSDASGSSVETRDIQTAMAGAEPLSFGSIFGGSVAAPATFVDTGIDFSRGAKVEYAIQSIGFSFDDRESLPAGVDQGYTWAGFATVVTYVLLPILDMVVGLPDKWEKILEFVQFFTDAGMLAIDLTRVFLATSMSELLGEAKNAVISLLEFAINHDSLLELGLTAAVNTTVKQLLKAIGFVFGVANLTLFAISSFRVPDRHVLKAVGTGSGVVVVS